jgi:hypothetical protein
MEMKPEPAESDETATVLHKALLSIQEANSISGLILRRFTPAGTSFLLQEQFHDMGRKLA